MEVQDFQQGIFFALYINHQSGETILTSRKLHLYKEKAAAYDVCNSWDAAGRTRTGTAVNRLILSQVRLPIPPQRHEKWFVKTELYNSISADKKQAFYF